MTPQRVLTALATAVLVVAVVMGGPPETSARATAAEVDVWIARAEADWRARPVAALALAGQAETAAVALGDERRRAEALRVQARALDKSRATDEAVVQLERAIAIEERRQDREAVAETTLLLARMLRRVGRHEDAAARYAALDTYYRDRGDTAGLARIDAQESVAAVRRGDSAVALERGEHALRVLAGREGELDRSLVAASAVAYALHQLERWPEAQAAYDRVVDLAWQAGDQASLNFAYCNRAEAAWRQGDAEPALDDLERAVRGLEEARATLHTAPSRRVAFFDEQVLAYDRLIRYLADTDRGRHAFAVAERFHARSLLDDLVATPGTGAPENDREHRRLLDATGRARLELEAAMGPRAEAARTRLAGLEAERERRAARQARAQADSWTAAEPPDPAAVRRGLEPGEALVAYWLTEDRILIWSHTRGHSDYMQIPVPRASVVDTVDAFLGPLTEPSRATYAALAAQETDHQSRGRELYRWLIAPLPRDVREARRIVIVPDGVLHTLPFEALVRDCDAAEPQGAEGGGTVHAGYRRCRYLGLERPLVYSPSAAAYLALRRRRPGPSAGTASLLALAPSFDAAEASATVRAAVGGGKDRGLVLAPLAFSRTEVERIGRLFPGARTLVGDRASEKRLKQDAGAYRFLHLATHGLVRDDLPMSSGVLLRPGADEDGLLQVAEVLDLTLRADLVTLSACRTGRGRLHRGEGVEGLSRAFLHAGAASVLVSQWDVDDRTSPRFMEAFYRSLARGTDRATALMHARRALFAEDGTTRLLFRDRAIAYAHPRYWAGFALIGTP